MVVNLTNIVGNIIKKAGSDIFFLIVGNNDFWKYEIEFLKPVFLQQINQNIVIFKTELKYEELLSKTWKLSQIIKFWKVCESMSDLLFYIKQKWVDLIWVNDKIIWLELKQSSMIKRFKITKLLNSDYEIKSKWLEIIRLNKNYFWLVEWYQNISLFELIDFEKPNRWMEIGMMPSKLTLFLINLWVLNYIKNFYYKDKLTIWDPFLGFGTTAFLTNYLWYDFIWSDININLVKNNLQRWKQTKYYNENCKITIFKQNVLDQFKKKFLTNVDIIVSESWLWPKIKNLHYTSNQLYNNQQEVRNVQKKFLENIKNFYNQKIPIIVITIPFYIQNQYSNYELIKNLWKKLWFLTQKIWLYHRKWQKVWREILVIVWK